MQTCKVRDLIDIVIYYNGIKITEYHWKAKYQLLKEKNTEHAQWRQSFYMLSSNYG
jgi:hypothetical protein